jgi:cell division transport system ATP-binding protein
MHNLPLVVDLKNVTIQQSGNTILSNLNFDLTEAEICYIIGKSGSGKSSLLKAIYADAEVTQGEAKVLDFDLRKLKRERVPDLRRKLGMVFQDFRLFDQWTVAHNLSFVMVATDWRDKVAIKNRVEEVLSLVGLTHYFNSKVHQLSGGEQQRLAIGRAIINNPKLIIADEPTGNLDPETSDEILYLLNRIVRETKSALLLATHDYRLIQKFPSRILKCENRKLELV